MRSHTLLIAALLITINVSGQSGLKPGMIAPEIDAADNSGRPVELKSLLRSHRSVVLFFYRGQWCPYCNKYISHLQDSLRLLTDKGAYVIGVTPETEDNVAKTIQKTHASFSIIQDKRSELMTAYDVKYRLDDVTVSRLSQYGIDIENNNGNKEHWLPVPATYIIGKSGRIKYVHFDKDYTKRVSVSTLLQKLQ